jgi:rhodanese-related sulfurtransferase
MTSKREAYTTVPEELDPKQAQVYIRNTPDLQLIDVREADEYREARIAGAKLISLSTLPARLHEIDRNRPILLYCHGGGRSGRALDFLRSQGYPEVRHIAGGIMAWAASGLSYES